MNLRKDADYIIANTIRDNLPDIAVKRAIEEKIKGNGNLYLVAIGKAAWHMAKAAKEGLSDKIKEGVVITKYNHVKGELGQIRCFEGGHPIPDENSVKATKEAEKLISTLKEEDTVLFLVSGGGSALFEDPEVELEELENITKQMLACGASIVEMNSIRKRLSKVKGGKFAKMCEPAKVYSIVLSDILGDPLDMIASGPAYMDSSTSKQAIAIVDKYNLKLSDKAKDAIKKETPKHLSNVETTVSGSVKALCNSAKIYCEELGYETQILTDSLCCEAKDAGSFLASIGKTYEHKGKKAFIVGGETIVHLKGKGKGGRNQEFALSAAEIIDGCKNIAVFSVGSDGTDGPTDAAGGYVDGSTCGKLRQKGIEIYRVLENNDAYHALEQVDGLVMTGPTGTNVNDFAVVLIEEII